MALIKGVKKPLQLSNSRALTRGPPFQLRAEPGCNHSQKSALSPGLLLLRARGQLRDLLPCCTDCGLVRTSQDPGRKPHQAPAQERLAESTPPAEVSSTPLLSLPRAPKWSPGQAWPSAAAGHFLCRGSIHSSQATPGLPPLKPSLKDCTSRCGSGDGAPGTRGSAQPG